MRILVYSWKDLSHPESGGAEVYTHEVAKRWVSMGHEVTLFTSTFTGSEGEEVRDGYRILRRGGRSGLYGSLFWEARRFYSNEGRGNFDLVFDQINTRPFWCPTFVDDATVVALIHQVAREVWFYESPLPVALLGRFVFEPRWLKKYREIPTVAVSYSTKRSLESYGLRNVTVVPQGFTSPLRASTNVPKEFCPTVLFVGRLSSSKRPRHVLRAFERVSRVLPDAKLWMVGTGPQEARLRRIAPSRVTFFGKVSEDVKYELMARAHVLVMTSVREGWGLAVTEAASVGTPAVTYEVDGLRDSVSAARGLMTARSPRRLAEGVLRSLEITWPGIDISADSLADWNTVATQLLQAAVDGGRHNGHSGALEVID